MSVNGWDSEHASRHPDFAAQAWTQAPYLFEHIPTALGIEDISFARVAEIVAAMPPQDIIYRSAAGGVNSQMTRLPLPDWSAVPLHARLAAETTSLMLQNVERYDREFRTAVDRLIEWAARTLSVSTQQFKYCTASIFLSSPGAISSYHTDREQNFLVHLRGQKIVHVFPRRLSVPQELLVAMFRKRKGIHFEYDPMLESAASLYPLRPGNILYVPRNCPHWVDNSDQVAMSLSINFFRPADFLLEQFYHLNDKLRARFTRVCRPRITRAGG